MPNVLRYLNRYSFDITATVPSSACIYGGRGSLFAAHVRKPGEMQSAVVFVTQLNGSPLAG